MTSPMPEINLHNEYTGSCEWFKDRLQRKVPKRKFIAVVDGFHVIVYGELLKTILAKFHNDTEVKLSIETNYTLHGREQDSRGNWSIKTKRVCDVLTIEYNYDGVRYNFGQRCDAIKGIAHIPVEQTTPV